MYNISTINLLELGLLGQKGVNFLQQQQQQQQQQYLRCSALKERVTKGQLTRYDFCLLILSLGVSFRAGRRTQRPVV